MGYNRRASSNPERPESAKDAITIPGVTPETFPYFNIGYSIAPMGYTRQVGEDRIIQDNVTFIAGRHNLKMGFETIRTLYSDKADLASLGSIQLHWRRISAVRAEHRKRLCGIPDGRSDERDVQQATGDIHAAAVEPGVVLPGRLESAGRV